MEKYEILGIAGEGAFGTVLRARNKATRKNVAIKKFKDREDEATRREVALLKQLNHQNVVRLLEVFRTKGRLHLVFEFVPQDMLALMGKYQNGMPEPLAKRYTVQLLRALDYCHKNNVIHRDVKPENLLIMGDPTKPDPDQNTLKLCDFGVARSINDYRKKMQMTGYIATRWYRAPELLIRNEVQAGPGRRVVRQNHSEYTVSVDVWAVGCILMELLTAAPLFPGKNDVDQLHLIKVFGGGGAHTAQGAAYMKQLLRHCNFPPAGIDFLQSLLAYRAEDRLTAETALRHPYLASETQANEFMEEELADSEEEEDGDDDYDDDFDDDDGEAKGDKLPVVAKKKAKAKVTISISAPKPMPPAKSKIKQRKGTPRAKKHVVAASYSDDEFLDDSVGTNGAAAKAAAAHAKAAQAKKEKELAKAREKEKRKYETERERKERKKAKKEEKKRQKAAAAAEEEALRRKPVGQSSKGSNGSKASKRKAKRMVSKKNMMDVYSGFGDNETDPFAQFARNEDASRRAAKAERRRERKREGQGSGEGRRKGGRKGRRTDRSSQRMPSMPTRPLAFEQNGEYGRRKQRSKRHLGGGGGKRKVHRKRSTRQRDGHGRRRHGGGGGHNSELPNITNISALRDVMQQMPGTSQRWPMSRLKKAISDRRTSFKKMDSHRHRRQPSDRSLGIRKQPSMRGGPKGALPSIF